MKRSISIILSLVLLVSSLVIPMSVSATGEIESEKLISDIQSAAAALRIRDDHKDQILIPLGNLALPDANDSSITNTDYKQVLPNDITTNSGAYVDLVSTVGTKVVKLPTDYKTGTRPATSWGTDTETDALVSYQPIYTAESIDNLVVQTAYYLRSKLKNFSFSVKTNKDITVTLKFHDGSATFDTSKSFNISASENWQEIKCDFATDMATANKDRISGIFALVSDGNGTQGFYDDAEVYFGSMFAETFDENVTAVTDISTTGATGVAECIVAAEKIDTSRYTDATALKSAITVAKKALIAYYVANDDITNFKTFLNNEIDILSKTDILLISNFGGYYDSNNSFQYPKSLPRADAGEKPNGLTHKYTYPSADENWRYMSGTLAALVYADPSVTDFVSSPKAVPHSEYDDIYTYVIDNSYTIPKAFYTNDQITAHWLTQFGALSGNGSWVNGTNELLSKLDNAGYVKMTSIKTKMPIKSDGVYTGNLYNTSSTIKGFQIFHRYGWSDNSEIAFSPIYGVKYCKTSVTEATDIPQILNIVNTVNVSDWDNGSILTETVTILKDVVFIKTSYNDDTFVTPTDDCSYTLKYAKPNEEFKFTVDVKNGGAVTSVTYGGADVNADSNGVYIITVDNAKTLEIKTTRDGYAPVNGILTVDSGAKRDIIDHSTANNHPTWSQNKDTLKNETETVVYQEPVVFYTDNLGTDRATSKLLYPVKNIVAVTSYTTIDGEFVKYYKDKDFTITEDGQIALTAETTIPRNFALNEMKTENIWNAAGNWQSQLPKNQVLVTYTYTETWGDVDYSVPTYYNSISTAYDKLGSGDTLDVLFIGDSISTGCNASGQDGVFYTYNSTSVGNTTTLQGWSRYLGLNTKPYWVNDSWDKQVVANLQKAYPDAQINVTNRSVGSSASGWYYNHIDELLVTGELGDAYLENTDLVFIGFGMNEWSNTAETQNANTKLIIDYLRQKNPNVSIVLVSAFYPTVWDSNNQKWTNYKLGEQEDGYFELAKQYTNIAVAPVNTAFVNILKAKEGVDYISNGINHPNDYGVNLYADTITATLINNATVTAPKALELLTKGIVGGTGSSEGQQTTAIYLLAEYDTPMYAGGKTANPKKIILDDGNVATVVSRTFYVASKSVYDSLENKDDFGKTTMQGVKSITASTGTDLAKYWKKYPIGGTNNATISFGVCIKNIKKDQKDNAFAVRAKVEYRLGDGGHIFTIYSDVQTADNFSAQGAYDVLASRGQQPSLWFNTGYDDGSTEGDDFFG